MKAGDVIGDLELPVDELHEIMAELGVDGPSMVEPVAYDSGSPATGALARVKGDGWSVFVKQIQAVRHWPRLFLVPEPVRNDFAAQFPWRAELAIWDEAFAGRLPKHLRVPTLYRLTDLGDDRMLIWMENVDALSDADWTLDHFIRAATALGGLAARRMDPQTLAATGMAKGLGLRMYVEGRVYHDAIPKLRDGEIWRHPRLAEAPGGLRARLAALAENCDTVLDRLDQLPQAVPHGDASPQNLLVPRSAPDEFVAIDIAFQHPLAIGFDLGQLLIGLVHAGHLEPARLREIHERLVPAYVAGMAEEGYDADPADVHYGYVGSLLVRAGFTAIPYELLQAPDTEALFRRRLELTEFLADIGTEII
jgi:hypothetical protein